MSRKQARIFGGVSKPGKVKPAMTYCLNTQEPNTKYYGKFAPMMQSDRWYKCVIKLHMYKEKESDQLDIITITHFSTYKTNILEYGRQIQAIINEYLEYGFYDDNGSTVRVTIGDKPKCLENKHDK